MRKFLAALMAVLMLASVLAVMPVSAETALPECEHDGSSANAGNIDNMSLVVTEVVHNSSNSYAVNSAANFGHKDAFTYIEIYNRGSSPIDLSTLKLARMRDHYAPDSGLDFYNNTFTSSVPINAGSIYDGINMDATTVQKYQCKNEMDLTLEGGEFAILWIWNSDTVAVDEAYGEQLGMPKTVGGQEIYHYYFRQHYGIDNDVKVVAVYGGYTKDVTSGTYETFKLNQGSSFVYGLVDKTFDVNVDKVFDETGLNAKVKSTWQWGVNRASSVGGCADGTVETANRDNKGNLIELPIFSANENRATLYAPADSTPVFYNAQRGAADESYQPAVNYVAIGSDYVYSYKEMAVMVPYVAAGANTIGKMDPAQWAQVDPDRYTAQLAKAAGYVDAGTGNGDINAYKAHVEGGNPVWTEAGGFAWISTATTAFVNANVQKSETTESRDETKINLVFKDRSQLGNKGQNKGNTTVTEEKGLPVWALILIIVGGVLLLAGIAVVVIVILKKKKPVAEDDVAVEGEVVIIDETEAQEKTEE